MYLIYLRRPKSPFNFDTYAIFKRFGIRGPPGENGRWNSAANKAHRKYLIYVLTSQSYNFEESQTLHPAKYVLRNSRGRKENCKFRMYGGPYAPYISDAPLKIDDDLNTA